MNELQQVLLIFAVVVIAGLYFLSRSRQSKSSQNKDASPQAENSTSNSQSKSQIEHTLNSGASQATSDFVNVQKKKASEALNELGTPHIPLSSNAEERLTTEPHASNIKHADSSNKSFGSLNPPLSPFEDKGGLNEYGSEASVAIDSESSDQNKVSNISHPGQGELFFGEEFDVENEGHVANSRNQILTDQETKTVAPSITENITDESSEVNKCEPENIEGSKPKHHVLVVDDPGMTGEIEPGQVTPDETKPRFGIPEDDKEKQGTIYVSTDKKPEVFVLLVMSTGHEFAMTDLNQALYGVGLTLSDQSIFVKKDNMGNEFIKVANMLEPGTFPVENLEQFNTPGIAMILELPTTVRAPAAMHDLIMMARKVSQRMQGRLYNMDRHLIKESDLQSMRDAALDYESEPL